MVTFRQKYIHFLLLMLKGISVSINNNSKHILPELLNARHLLEQILLFKRIYNL